MIFPRLGFSRKRHVPALYIGGRGLFPWEYPTIAWRMREWKLERKGPDSYVVINGEEKLLLTRNQAGAIVCEWKDWIRFYLPHFSLKEKTVLDVGAGCGETAYFYFQHGAEKIIAIEMDELQVSLLKKNAEVNKWNIKLIPRAFEIEDLRREKFDLAKIDIEGGERELLKLDKIDFPLVLEAHGTYMRDVLTKRFGLSVMSRGIPMEDVWLLANCI